MAKKRTTKPTTLAQNTGEPDANEQDGETSVSTYSSASIQKEGMGPNSAGQSGDTQGLSGDPEADSQSVLELTEDGQFLEAEAIGGVENSADPDVEEVHTREVPEDDVPEEYDDQTDYDEKA